jgi:hypothetical protein
VSLAKGMAILAVATMRGGACKEIMDVDQGFMKRIGVPGQAHHPSVRGFDEVRDAHKKGARLASVGTLETVLYQALKGWLQHVTK